MPPVRLAVMGLGSVTRQRVIPSLVRNPDLTLVGVIDRHAGRAEQIGRQYNVLHAETESLSKVNWFNQVDALIVATSPKTHADLAILALNLGKHVLVEKPFAMSPAEGESMAGLAKEKGLVLAVMHNFQFSRAATKLLNDIEKGRLGAIRRVAVNQLGNPRRPMSKWLDQLPAGLFYDESPHFYYILQRLTGKDLKLVRSFATPALIRLTYENANQIPVTVDCDYNSPLTEWHIMVAGEKAMGIYDLYRDFYIRLPNDQTHAMLHVLRTSLCAIAQHAFQYIPNGIAHLMGSLDYGVGEVLARFGQAVQGKTEALNGMSSEDALNVLRLQHEALRAVQVSER